jgi:hypothetical protein
MERVVLYNALFVAALLAGGFLAGRVVGRPWTRWLVAGIFGTFVVLSRNGDVGTLLRAVPATLVVIVLGYGAATLGIRLRRGPTIRDRVTP